MKSPGYSLLLIILIVGGFFSCTFNTTGIDPGNDIFSFNQAEFLIEFSEDELLVSMLIMIGQVNKLSDQQIQNIDEAKILEIAAPLQKARTNSARFDEVSLEKLSGPFEAFVQAVDTMTLVTYSTWSEKLQQLISESSVITPSDLAYSYQEIKNLFISFNSNPRSYTSWCSELFNVTSEGQVILTRGDSFAVANLFCPGNTTFLAEPGIHTGQNIPYSKYGNTWIGFGEAIMDGENRIDIAFHEGLNDNEIRFLTITNYNRYGIKVIEGASDVLIRNMVFKNIAVGEAGYVYGAVYFRKSKNIRVMNSHFEDVASSVRYRHSEGPLIVHSNTALNPGRNFFQCGDCNGREIQVTRNSLDHIYQVSEEPMEDFINIFNSHGLEDDYIKVNNNRARTGGLGISQSGSFIILGDFGGTYQEAKENIGVNPGNVGIGAGGGEHIKVIDNKMYSAPIINVSNVAFYSMLEPVTQPQPCGNHDFRGNVANWTYYTNITGELKQFPNFAWAAVNNENEINSDIYCGLWIYEIRDSSRVRQDLLMGPEIWDSW